MASSPKLSDAWTLFAPSRRRHLVEKRGRFGYGEKESHRSGVARGP